MNMLFVDVRRTVVRNLFCVHHADVFAVNGVYGAGAKSSPQMSGHSHHAYVGAYASFSLAR